MTSLLLESVERRFYSLEDCFIFSHYYRTGNYIIYFDIGSVGYSIWMHACTHSHLQGTRHVWERFITNDAHVQKFILY